MTEEETIERMGSFLQKLLEYTDGLEVEGKIVKLDMPTELYQVRRFENKQWLVQQNEGSFILKWDDGTEYLLSVKELGDCNSCDDGTCEIDT